MRSLVETATLYRGLCGVNYFMSHMRKVSLHFRFGTLTVALLIGCASGDMVWQNTGEQGPIVLGGERSILLEKCEAGSTMSDVRRCRWIFRWKSGEADLIAQVGPSLDDMVSKLPEFRTWRDYGGKKDAPFDLVLISLQPLALIAAPLMPGQRARCDGYPGGKYRISSKIVYSGYSFCTPVLAKEGSFWVIESGERGAMSSDAEFFIPTLNSKIKMS